MASERVSLDEPFDADVERRELAALQGFAFLLTADPGIAGELAHRAAAGSKPSGPHRKAIGDRASVARRARKARAPAAGSPVIEALLSLPHRERTVLVASLYDHASEAEVAFIAGCAPSEVASLLERAMANAARALGEEPQKPGLPGMLRMGMLAAVEQLDQPTDEHAWAQRRPGWGKRAALVAAVAMLAATAISVTYGADEDAPAPHPSAVVDDRYGFRLTIVPTWRSISTTARGGADNVDPATLGLAIEDPSGDQTLLIPRRARERPAMLRISGAPSRSFDEDVSAFRERIAVSTDEPRVTSVVNEEVASRPAIRFSLERYDEDQWCSLCIEHTWLVHWLHGTTLTIELRVFGPGALLEEATQMVRSMRVVPGAMRYQPKRGSVAPGLVVDEQLEVLLQFLDARAMGIAPSAWLDDDAVFPPDLLDVAAYRVLRGADGVFEVSVERRDRLGRSLGTRGETIAVGPGTRREITWPIVVLAVEVMR